MAWLQGPGRGVLAAFAFALVLIAAGSWSLPLMDPDEGRNAQIALEMASSGNWIIPTFGGIPYLDKPAFFFATVALSFRTFGSNELAARLPSALFALALLLLAYRFAVREYGARSGVLAVVVVASMPMFAGFAHLVIFDMPLAFFVSAAIIAGYRAEAAEGRRRRNAYLLGALCAGLATLVKGPVGFVVPALVLLAFARVDGNRGAARRLLGPMNLGVFAIVVLPWVAAASLQRPDFLYYSLVRETLQRFTMPAFERSAPFFYYGPVIVAACYGWSVLLPEAAVVAWRRRAAWRRADRLLVTWVVVVVAIFSLSQSKLPGYVLSATVAIGLLLAGLFDRALEAPDGRAAAIVMRGTVLLAAVSLALAGWLTVEVVAPGYLTNLFHIVGRAYERSRPIFPAAITALLICAAAALAARASRRVGAALAAFLVVPVLTLTVCFSGLRLYAESASSRRLAAAVAELAPDATVVCMQCYPPGLPFYLRRPVTLITGDGSETTSNYIPFYLDGLQDWPEHIIPVQRRNDWLRQRDGALLLLAREENRAAMEDLAGAMGGVAGEIPGGWLYLLLPAQGNS